MGLAELVSGLFAIGLVGFILWSNLAPRRKTSVAEFRGRFAAGFSPGAAIPEFTAYAFAAIMAVLAVWLAVYPATPPFTGRGAWVLIAAHSVGGSLTLVGGCLLLAFALLWLALARRRQRLQSQINPDRKRLEG